MTKPISRNTKEKIIKIIKLSVDKILSKAYNNKCRQDIKKIF